MKSLKLNDKVKVIAGAHKGEEAVIAKMDRKAGKAMLEGIGLVERHMKKTQFNPQGGKKTIHVGIDLSNLKLVEAAKEGKTVKSAVKKVDKSEKSEKKTKDKKGAK